MFAAMEYHLKGGFSFQLAILSIKIERKKSCQHHLCAQNLKLGETNHTQKSETNKKQSQ